MRGWTPLLALVGLLAHLPARGVFPDGFNHPEVSWLEFDTDHFTLVYNEGLESTARLAAGLLEGMHPAMCADLGVEPTERTVVVLADFDDVGFNNFTRRMQHVIYLSNPVMNQGRVSREQWLEHLLAHEYTHVLNGWAYRRAGRAVGHWIEWSGMELQPQWFTEGLAEYQAARRSTAPVSYVLDAAREGELLAGGKLDIREARFDVIETAVVYKQGHAMVVEMVRRWGPDVLRRLLEQYAHTPQFDLAFKLETGDTVESFTRRFIDQATEQAGVVAQVMPGDLLATRLDAALAARMSPDGQQVAVYGVADWEDPVPHLYLMRPDGTGWRHVASNLDLYDSWKFSWSADSRYLVYIARVKHRTGSIRNALYIHDTQRRRSWKLDTGELRVFEPEFSPVDQRIAFVTYRDERAILAVLEPETMAVTEVTAGLAESCFSPTWSPDGGQLAFSVTAGENTDIAVINLDGTGFRRLTDDPWPDQYPDWSPSGGEIAFVSYRAEDGAGGYSAVAGEAEGLAGAGTNVYSVPAGGGTLRQISNVPAGGLYYPAWTSDGTGLLASLLRIRRADIVRLSTGTPVASAGEAVLVSGGRSVQPSAVAAAANLPGPGIGTESRPYRGAARLRPFVLRPIQGEDGLGDAWGARATFGDPLLRHNVVAEMQLGAFSDRITYEIHYLDDQSPLRVGANVFRRVPNPRGERGALVAETSEGAELLAEWPLALTSNPYVQDKLIFGFEVAQHTPFGTAGGVLRPPPASAWIIGPSIGWRRVQLIPGSGDQEVLIKFTRADDLFGSDLSFVKADGLWARRFFAPNPRSTVTAGVALDWFDGRDFTHSEVEHLLLAAEARYDLRLADELFSRHTWPYLHVGPVHLTASYQLRELVNGTAGGADLRDRFTLELTNEGYLSRHVVYLVRAGQRWHLGGNNESDTYIGISFDFRELPY